MPSNADTLKTAYESFQRGDIPGVLSVLDADVEWHVPQAVPHGGDFRGHDGALEFFGGIEDKWDGLGVDVSEMLADGDTVVVIGRAAGLLRATGEDVGYGFVHVWTMRDGSAVRFDEYVAPPAELPARA